MKVYTVSMQITVIVAILSKCVYKIYYVRCLSVHVKKLVSIRSDINNFLPVNSSAHNLLDIHYCNGSYNEQYKYQKGVIVLKDVLRIHHRRLPLRYFRDRPTKNKGLHASIIKQALFHDRTQNHTRC